MLKNASLDALHISETLASPSSKEVRVGLPAQRLLMQEVASVALSPFAVQTALHDEVAELPTERSKWGREYLSKEQETLLAEVIEAGTYAEGLRAGRSPLPLSVEAQPDDLEIDALISQKELAVELFVKYSSPLVNYVLGKHGLGAFTRDVGLEVAHEELEAAGALGLKEALKRYDFTRDNRLFAYSTHWVRNRVQMFIAERIGVAQAIFGEIHVIWAVEKRLAKELQRRPTAAEIAKALGEEDGIDRIEKRLTQLSDLRTLPASINASPRGNIPYPNHEDKALEDLLADPGADITSEHKELYRAIVELGRTQPRLAYYVLQCDISGRTIQEVNKELGLHPRTIYYQKYRQKAYEVIRAILEGRKPPVWEPGPPLPPHVLIQNASS